MEPLKIRSKASTTSFTISRWKVHTGWISRLARLLVLVINWDALGTTPSLGLLSISGNIRRESLRNFQKVTTRYVRVLSVTCDNCDSPREIIGPVYSRINWSSREIKIANKRFTYIVVVRWGTRSALSAL